MPLITLPGEVNLETAVAKRGNFLVTLTYKDLAAGVVSTALAVSAFTPLITVQGLELDHIELVTPFQDTTDAANNSALLTIGDATTANRYLTSTETNANGAYVSLAFGTGTKFVPSINQAVLFTLTPIGGKNVANYNAGKLLAYFKLTDQRVVV